MRLILPEPLRTALTARLGAWRAQDGTKRLWAKDASLWTGKDEARWLGWLDIVPESRAALPSLEQLAAEIKREGFRHIAVIGMGGSSLAPDVLSWTAGGESDDPELVVLDSTEPTQIATFEAQLDLERTLFCVASKSGSTLEPSILRDYFLARVREKLGDKAGSRFIAITDPGSQLEQQAKQDGFRTILYGVPEIGGRFSALSHFGMAPAVLAGLPVSSMLDWAEQMVESCREADPSKNPGVVLGALMAASAQRGHDKLTILASQPLDALGIWLEQLIAESTGKHGAAVIPVDREPVGPPERYGSDRLFVRIRVEGFPADEQDAALVALVQAGHPAVEITVKHAFMIGAEFFRWEFATAVCGAMMGLNPFDQPDVEASKIATRRIMTTVETTGALPDEGPVSVQSPSMAARIKALLTSITDGDYFALLAWLEMSEANEAALAQIRLLVRDARRVATTVGFGPRFLHSTGQAHKGGPNTGVFLQLTREPVQDLPVPGRRYSFGTVAQAQAHGDLAVLVERGRRVLHIHLGKDVASGLSLIAAAVRQALA